MLLGEARRALWLPAARVASRSNGEFGEYELTMDGRVGTFLTDDVDLAILKIYSKVVLVADNKLFFFFCSVSKYLNLARAYFSRLLTIYIYIY